MKRHAWSVLVLALALSAACAAETPAHEPTPEGVIATIERPLVLADDVVVPSDDARLLEVRFEDDGRLRFVYAGAPERPIGIGAVIVGNEGRGYMGRVLEVEAAGDDRLVRFEPVGLDEVIEDGAFRVQLEPDAAEILVEGDVGGLVSPLGGRFDLVPREILDGAGFCEGLGGASLRVSHELETSSIGTDFVFEREGLLGVRKAGVTATGGVILTVVLETEGDLDARCAVDVLEALNARGVRIGARVWEKRFRVGPLPLSVSLRITPTFTANALVKVEPSRVTTTVVASADLTLGVLYERGRGVRATSALERDASVDVQLSEGGHAEAELRAHAGVFFALDVNFLQLPRAGAELEARASFRTDDLACTYEWEASVSGRAHLRGELGVDLGFFSRTFATLNEERSFTAQRRGEGAVALPWCDDAPTDPVDPADPTTADERCAAFADCDSCNASAGCGFCEATGVCMSDRRRAECGESWQDSRASCIDCGALAGCDSCNRNGFCGWCASSGSCLNAADGRPAACEPIDWSTNVASCG
ncbi:MAG: hypothetical protein KF901_00540 [Myxococcales bacterium]|nr:hypothetical protein [Myxococcales bacterium]